MLSQVEIDRKYGHTAPNHPGFLMERMGFFKAEDEPAEGHPELVGLRHAHAHLVKTWDAVYTLIDRYGRDPSLTEGHKIKSIAKEASAAQRRAHSYVTTAVDKGADAAASLRTELRLSTRPISADAGMDAEVREHFRNVGIEQATELLNASLNDYSDEGTAILRAVAAVPVFMSGVNPAAHALAKERYLQRVKPKEYHALQQYEEALGKVAKAKAAMDEFIRDFVDFDTADKLESLSVRPEGL